MSFLKPQFRNLDFELEKKNNNREVLDVIEKLNKIDYMLHAIRIGSIELLKMCFYAGVVPIKETVLYALDKGNAEIFKMVFEKSGLRTSDFDDLLCMAIEKGYDMVYVVLSMGCEVSEGDLEKAKGYGDEGLVGLLVNS